MNQHPLPVKDAAPAKAAGGQSWRLKYGPTFANHDDYSRTGWYQSFKPVLDFVLAVLLLIPALPLMAFSALLVRLFSAGPAFYVQVRLGRFGRPYRLVKIRTMYNDCERLTGACWSTPGDPRITPIGHFLRKTHLDELPQLFNVLRGEMSLVGPRPERPEIVPALEAAVPGYSKRLFVKPGVTGLAQVQLPADTDMASVRRKLSYDMYYVHRHNFWLDVRLIVCTAFKCVGMSFSMQRRLFRLPFPDQIERVSQIPLEGPSFANLAAMR